MFNTFQVLVRFPFWHHSLCSILVYFCHLTSLVLWNIQNETLWYNTIGYSILFSCRFLKKLIKLPHVGFTGFHFVIFFIVIFNRTEKCVWQQLKYETIIAQISVSMSRKTMLRNLQRSYLEIKCIGCSNNLSVFMLIVNISIRRKLIHNCQ